MAFDTQARTLGRRPVVAAVAAGAVLVTGLVAVWQYRAGSSDTLDPALRDLAQSLDQARAGEGRYSGFPYGTIAPVRRSASNPPIPVDIRLATAGVEKLVGEDRSPKARHRLGVAFAFDGRLDDSVNALSESAAAAPGDPAVWTDLSASFLARSRPDDLSGASDAAQRALMLSPSSHAARFNRALALERLHLDREAQAEWE